MLNYRNMAKIFASCQKPKIWQWQICFLIPKSCIQRPIGRTSDISFITDSSFVLNLMSPLSLWISSIAHFICPERWILFRKQLYYCTKKSICSSWSHTFNLEYRGSYSKCYFFFFKRVPEGLAVGGLSFVGWYSMQESLVSPDAAGVTCNLGTVNGLMRDLITGGTLGVGRTGELAQRAAVVSCVTRE